MHKVGRGWYFHLWFQSRALIFAEAKFLVGTPSIDIIIIFAIYCAKIKKII